MYCLNKTLNSLYFLLLATPMQGMQPLTTQQPPNAFLLVLGCNTIMLVLDGYITDRPCRGLVCDLWESVCQLAYMIPVEDVVWMNLKQHGWVMVGKGGSVHHNIQIQYCVAPIPCSMTQLYEKYTKTHDTNVFNWWEAQYQQQSF